MFKVVLKYVASPETEGKSRIRVGNNVFDETITATQTGNAVIIKELGTVTLDKGISEINISALDIKKAELMKLLEIQLVPVEKKK
jgi:alpha-L-fucosidase